MIIGWYVIAGGIHLVFSEYVAFCDWESQMSFNIIIMILFFSVIQESASRCDPFEAGNVLSLQGIWYILGKVRIAKRHDSQRLRRESNIRKDLLSESRLWYHIELELGDSFDSRLADDSRWVDAIGPPRMTGCPIIMKNVFCLLDRVLLSLTRCSQKKKICFRHDAMVIHYLVYWV